MLYSNKDFILSCFRCCHCSCTIFIFTLYSFYTQVMLILILIDVQYLQKVVFSFEKGLNGQKHSSGSHHSIKNFLQQNFPSPHLLTLFGKPCMIGLNYFCHNGSEEKSWCIAQWRPKFPSYRTQSIYSRFLVLRTKSVV